MGRKRCAAALRKTQAADRAERYGENICLSVVAPLSEPEHSFIDASVGLTAAPAAGNAYGHVAEWLRSGLQNRLPRFNSGRGLHQLPQALSPIVAPDYLVARMALGTRWGCGSRLLVGQNHRRWPVPISLATGATMTTTNAKDAIVVGVGSGGTLTGIGRFMAKHSAATRMNSRGPGRLGACAVCRERAGRQGGVLGG